MLVNQSWICQCRALQKKEWQKVYMGVSLHGGTPKSSISIGFSIINHPFWGIHIFWKHPYSFRFVLWCLPEFHASVFCFMSLGFTCWGDWLQYSDLHLTTRKPEQIFISLFRSSKIYPTNPNPWPNHATVLMLTSLWFPHLVAFWSGNQDCDLPEADGRCLFFLVWVKGHFCLCQPGDTGREWKHINGACPNFERLPPILHGSTEHLLKIWMSFVSILWPRLACTSNGREKEGLILFTWKQSRLQQLKSQGLGQFEAVSSHDEKHLLRNLPLTLWGHGPSQKCPSLGGGVWENTFLLQPISLFENLLDFWLRTGGPSP